MSAHPQPPRRYEVVADVGVGFGAIAIALDAPARDPDAALDEAHARAAAVEGGVQLALSQHPPIVRSLGAPPWWVVRIEARDALTPRQVRNALPRDVALMKHARQAALAQALTLAFERQDLELLHHAAGEAIVEPALGPKVPGYFPAKAAALAAGASLAAFAGRDGCIVAICGSSDSAQAAHRAAAEAFAAHRVDVESLIARIAPLGELAASEPPGVIAPPAAPDETEPVPP